MEEAKRNREIKNEELSHVVNEERQGFTNDSVSANFEQCKAETFGIS